MKPGKAILMALLACAIAPAAAGASTAQVTGGGELRVDGGPGENNSVQIVYRTADEAGFNGVSDRFVVEDSVAIQPASETCVSIPNDPKRVTCDARPVSSMAVFLGDGDDRLAISNDPKSDGVPSRYPTLAQGGEGNDVLKGGVADDRMLGEGGRDVVAGWLGNDLVSGGPGTDAVIGFGGNDTLLGEGGGDVLFAQKGHDRLLGGPGRDLLQADDGMRDPKINCGPGHRQQALADRHDPKPSRCGKPPGKGEQGK